MYILAILREVFSILTKPQRRNFYFLIGVFLVSALLQVVGVVSISPFVTLLSDPEIVKTNMMFSTIYRLSGATNSGEFIVMFAEGSLVAIVISNVVSAYTLWLLVRFSVGVGAEMQERLYEGFLTRDYVYHKSANYNRAIALIGSEGPRFVYMVLQPILVLSSQIFVVLIIVGGLIAVDPIVAFISATVIGGAYLLTYVGIRKSLVFHGLEVTYRSDWVQRILSESFIGIKDIKLNKLEKKYLDRFSVINDRGLNSASAITLFGDLPRFFIETISFGAIILLAIYLLKQSQNPAQVVSLLSLYALAGYKLLPSLQQVYKSVSSISANGSVVYDLQKELIDANKFVEENTTERLALVDDISLESVTYTYPGANVAAIKDVSLSFKLGKLNTIAGHSGSGKSTLADVVLGLLHADSGVIKVNGIPSVAEHMTAYQLSTGYVPQQIFILDDTVLANVAFGVKDSEVDIARVEQALRHANAMEFVENMPLGMRTILGQDGKLLSGGQRQRIGIARALYRRSSILVLDEPTSALDIESEYEFMNLLNRLKSEVLIIVISHRPAAIKMSDNIFIVERGEVIADGSYADLLDTSLRFREMIEKGMMQTGQ